MSKKSKNKNKPLNNSNKKDVIETNYNHEVTGIIITAVGLLFVIGIYSNGSAILLNAIRDFLGGLFGSVLYAIPIIICIYGILVMFQKTEFTLKRKIFFMLLLFIFIAAINHIFYLGFNYEIGIKNTINYDALESQLYKDGIARNGGGLLGGLLSFMLIMVTGTYGSCIILGAFILILISFLTNISFVKIILHIKDGIVWIIKLAVDSLVYIFNKVNTHQEAKDSQTEDAKPPKVKNNLNVNIDGKSVEIDRKNIDKQIEEIKNIVPEKIEAQAADKYEQQQISDIKINEGIKSKIPKIENVEKIEIDVAASNVHGSYKMPNINLLNKPSESDKPKNSKKEILDNARKLEETLQSFGVDAKVVEVNRGPAVTRYELQPSVGVKVSKIVNLADDIALNLAASGIRIEAPIPGKAAVGIEVPNKEVNSVYLRDIIESDKFKNHSSKLAIALGKDIGGECIITDIAKMPHLLIAGATGSGKSVCINTLITSLIYKANPNEVKLLMVDPKVVELGVYNGIPHLLIPVVTEPKKAAGALNWAVQEMISRYKTFAEFGVRDIKGYNTLVNNTDAVLPQIVIIIDELADLMMVAPNDVEDAICRLAQMARAAGMHLVIATQRPSVDVITGVIKANIPSRISFAVSSQIDSRTILDMGGAEKLLGRGDMLFYPVGEAKPIRVQGAFISDKEVESIVEFIKNQSDEVIYSEDIMEQINADKEVSVNAGDCDELLPQAIEIIVESGQASVSMLQRRLKLGYARAARIIDQMEARGIIGGFEGSKPRQVLISKDQFYSGNFEM